MRFVYNQCNIPSLSWLAVLAKGADDITVYHGDKVECYEDWFVSGVWDGDFSEGNFDKSHFACCSGVKLIDNHVVNRGGGVMAVTPQHMSEQLFSYRDGNQLSVSNSLAFIIEFNNLTLDKDCYFFEEKLGSVLYGRYDWGKEFPISDSKNSEIINIHRCCKVVIGKDLCAKEEWFDSGLHFSSYEDYITKIRRVVQLIKTNAKDKRRKCQYGMISTASTGYDASATSALVHEVGCQEVITFKEPAYDCGDKIARTFGFENIYLEDANEFYNNKSFLEAEACCSGNIGGANFFAFEDLTKEKLIFMGFRGDTIWDKNNPYVNDDMNCSKHGFLYDTCLHDYESCYRTNSVIIPLPMIGLDRWSEVNAISNSEEMKQWSVGGDYDRPIPRRIIEEKGVKREAFGNKKQGAGTSYHFDTFRRLKSKMSVSSFNSLVEFERNCRRNGVKKFFYSLSYYLNEWPVYANFVMNKYKFKYRFNDKNTGMKSSPVSSLLFLWGISVVRNRYKIQ